MFLFIFCFFQASRLCICVLHTLGNIGPPVPPRSQISLINEETIYIVPNKASFKRPCKSIMVYAAYYGKTH